MVSWWLVTCITARGAGRGSWRCYHCSAATAIADVSSFNDCYLSSIFTYQLNNLLLNHHQSSLLALHHHQPLLSLINHHWTSSNHHEPFIATTSDLVPRPGSSCCEPWRGSGITSAAIPVVSKLAPHELWKWGAKGPILMATWSPFGAMGWTLHGTMLNH